MIKNISKYILALLVLIGIMSYGYKFLSDLPGKYVITSSEPIILHKPLNIYDDTLLVVGDKDNPPYSYLDLTGNPTGSEVELIYAIGNKLNKNIDIRLVDWYQESDDIRIEDVDIVLGLEYTDSYKDQFILTDAVEVNELVAFGKVDYKEVKEFYNKRIGVLEGTHSKELIVTPLGLDNQTTEYASYELAFEALQRDEIDYLLGRYAVGKRILLEKDITTIRPVGNVIASCGIAFGVNLNNYELRTAVNNAIKELDKEGVRSYITDKWLGNFVRIVTLQDYIEEHEKEIKIALLTILLMIITSIAYYIETLKNNAAKDHATGLYNKKKSEALISARLNKKSSRLNTVMMIDIDNFKSINDTYGHYIGDECIIKVSRVLEDVFRSSDILGRFGGDEFIVFSDRFKNKEEVEDSISQIYKLLSDIYINEADSLTISISIGVGIFSSPVDFETAYKKADKALYKVKLCDKKSASFIEVVD